MPFESQITFVIVFAVVSIVYHVYFYKVTRDSYHIIYPDDADPRPSKKRPDANWVHNDTRKDNMNATLEEDSAIPTYPAHIVFKDEPSLAEMEFEDLRYSKKQTKKNSRKENIRHMNKGKQASEDIEFEDMRHPNRREKRPAKIVKKIASDVSKPTNEVCYIIEVFLITDRAASFCDPDDELILMEKQNARGSSAIAATLVCAFLVYSISRAIYDVIRLRNVESLPPPDNELLRRCSLAEFANDREACLQLNHFSRRDSILMDTASVMIKRGMCRIDSSNSYLGRNRRESLIEGALVTSGIDSPNTSPSHREVKMLGGRPVPLLRRSSFPAAPLKPDGASVGAGRRPSVDSEDDSSPDGIRRRVRLIRRR